MQEELKRYSAKVVADGSSPIQGRVGINTGEVVVRSIQTGAGQVEYTPIGHTTNLASRMQTAAPVGSIAVSENTRRLCEGYFILKPLGATKSQRRQRAGQRLRSDRAGAAADAIAAFGGSRADEVRRARARDGSDARRRRARDLRPRADCRGDGGSGHRQVAAVLRVQGHASVGLDGAGDLLGLARQGQRLSAGARSLARLFQNRGWGR